MLARAVLCCTTAAELLQPIPCRLGNSVVPRTNLVICNKSRYPKFRFLSTSLLEVIFVYMDPFSNSYSSLVLKTRIAFCEA